jgi:hypothetical protein
MQRKLQIAGLLTVWLTATSVWAATPLFDFEFNEGSGTKITDSINSLVGTPGNPANPPTFTSDTPTGLPGDFATDYTNGQYWLVQDPTTKLQLNTNSPDFTIEAWVKPPSGTFAGRMVLFYNNGPGGAVSFSVNSDRTVFVTTLGIKDQSSTAAIPDDGNWHHIAVIHQNGVQFTFYVDGVLSDTESYTGGVLLDRNPSQPFFSIGSEWNNALQYTGELDRLKLYSGLLDPDELDFQAVPPKELVDFEFNEGSGAKTTDSVNSLVGLPGNTANPPTFTTDTPSGLAGDFATDYTNGQYWLVQDPTTKLQLNTNSPDFTIEAWVKPPSGTFAGRMVFFYNNGPGGAVSFSVNSDRTVFVTTLGIKDQSSTAAIPDDGKWHHIAVVHQNGVQFTFYVDGVLLDTEAYTGGVLLNRNPSQPFFSLGSEWNNALQYTGELDRLKVWSGMLPAAQLDTNPIPSAGAAGLTFASPSASPLGFSITLNQALGTLAATNTISLSLDGTAVTPSSVVQTISSTTIAYALPLGAPFGSGSTNTVTLTLKDSKGNSYTDNASFVVAAYKSLPLSAALPVTAVNTNDIGFKIQTYQIDGPSTNGVIETLAYNEAILAGEDGTNNITVPDPVFGKLDTNGYFTWSGVINFDSNTNGDDGYFTAPNYPKTDFPGIPGYAPISGETSQNFVDEILTAVHFTQPGMYTMAVITDWTGFPDAADGFELRCGPNPEDASSCVVLGLFQPGDTDAATRGVENAPLQFYVPKAGYYPFRLFYFESSSASQLEWIMENPDGTRSLVNDVTNSVTAYYAWTLPATLSLARAAGGGITLTFTGTLQSAPALSGPWTAVSGASPLTVPAPLSGAMKFYRAVGAGALPDVAPAPRSATMRPYRSRQ